jgi:uncharacterized protein (TIGR02145 family)
MKKRLLQLFAILLFTACQKEISMDKASEKIAGVDENKQAKISVCHYDAATGISKTIEINANALAGHLEHGDLQGDCSAVLTTICHQDWMIKNLDVDHYRNGDPIPQVTDQSAWMGLETGAWCYYNNDPANGTIYGKLYNWQAVNDLRGLAPVGWHIPSNGEWNNLAKCLDHNTNLNIFNQSPIAGGAMKENGSTHWIYPNTGATNSSGFTGLPGGYRVNSGFDLINKYGLWWSSSERNISMGDVWTRVLSYADGYIYSGSNFKFEGHSVRCLRD